MMEIVWSLICMQYFGSINTMNLTSRKKGRCHLITEKEAKRRIPLCWGGGRGEARWRPKPSPPPPWNRFTPKTGGFGQSSHFPTWGLVPKVAKGPDVEVMWQVWIWGKLAISLPIPQRVVLARNLFIKIDARNFYLPYCSVKICPPLSCELWERIFCFYS